MIAYLEGKIIHGTDKFVIINTGSVGYKVFLTPDTILDCLEGSDASLFIYTAVRENSIDLFGFKTIKELSFFELLLDVSGIGPRSALGIIAIAPIETIKRAIATGDVGYLNKVSGIGKKTAEKIIIELRDKLQNYKEGGDVPSTLREEGDIIEALKSLGYSQNEARDAMKGVSVSIEGTNARIKEALRLLSIR
ncbi:MAG: Holliday junction ATP-dependent DNA helicase RuvA [Candidatus Nomurabacteria bacterium GW2011_GWF2_35_66]|uniref:Holliday junction branch migration complex subunit RuvA n=1 Tax=Candidatus Nomurabacteria bacterium GW2011_GWE1_35_16 TaxID=1618761 RepID=A0A0G0DTZ9_9BACT|nr:MAG: Holliday junction ATP-dependent DNA helicase RuvA [Candidatus Nomurabacteria bacterium GW2011_GWF1_34_20]KKP63297.1 MAG: Holliday junction ATP-dependent DNA helicase RuvA [Candidatus Nomurabacteria bacterium GW2011_GWE2_34_25]KKP66495.1 MAG: Holliday junction ATP-dependent DNA helicase RuvA [Candidatus Nomurabacteria bacterium GW2011_GWE1_35_16]KKP83707.1 MAG: Holliday junction ATP-dependent DNA helicase RuvA [Candidatus Nomurabacteria bacterium GW2011_GWF2_35_66]HAE36931.1 Holliday jun